MDIGAFLQTEAGSTVAFLSVCFGGLGVLFIVVAFLTSVNLRRIRATYQTTGGRIIRTDIEEQSDSDGTTYHAVVEYQYTVNGQQYESRKLSSGIQVGIGNRATVERRVSAYHAGQMVQVYYDPEKPQQSVLEMKAPAIRFLTLLGMLFIVIVIVIAAATYAVRTS